MAENPTVIGAPPTLEWVSIRQLQVDAHYQRSTETRAGQRIIRGMTNQWNWSLCQPLSVARRADGSMWVADGSMWVVDGQHRLAGAIARGDIPHLPCVITTHGDVAAESAMFVALNTRRSRLSQGDIFNAACASGDADALAIAQLVADAGLSFARHDNNGSWHPGQIFCGPMLVNARRTHGDAVVRNALTALAESQSGRVMTSSAYVLRALIVVYAQDAQRPGFDPDLFIDGLGELTTTDWLDEGRRVKFQQPGLSRIDAIATAMVEAMDALKQDCAA